MYIKSEFDQNYSDVYDVKSIIGELKGAFFAVQKVLLLAGENIQQFLVTGKLDMTSLSEKEAKLIVKCRIKKPGYGNSKGYRAVFLYNIREEIPTSKLLLIYSKNHCPDNVQETQWIWRKLRQYHIDIYNYFRL